jgi:hypothetical protein
LSAILKETRSLRCLKKSILAHIFQILDLRLPALLECSEEQHDAATGRKEGICDKEKKEDIELILAHSD